MDNKMIRHMETAISKIKKRRSWQKIVSILGCTVAICVICALILPAIAMNKDTVCGLEEHTHTESCYTTQAVEGEVSLSCDLEKLNVHVHNADCYDPPLAKEDFYPAPSGLLLLPDFHRRCRLQ